MKQMLSFIYVLLWFLQITMLFSCKKSEQTNSSKTKTELITSAPWKRTALTSTPAYDWNADGVFDTNIMNTMFPCEKDNFETYYLNGMVETNEGASKCTPTDPQTWSVTWAFAENETKLIWDGYDEYTLLELTTTTLKFKSTFVENGISYTHVETYGH